VPSSNEIRWSQLKVGALVLVAVGVLIFLIFLMAGSTGGLFARKLVLRSYFSNASGLKNGAPVTLEGVTIGNVMKIRIVPARSPQSVEVTMQVANEFAKALHADSTTAISQAGVLGDSFIDISSAHATGPVPANNAELTITNSPTIQDVIQTSQGSIEQINVLMKKLDTLIDSINSGKGTAGQFINNPALYRKVEHIADDLQTITGTVASGKGSLGKLLHDTTLYDRANSAVDRFDKIATGLDEGKGTAANCYAMTRSTTTSTRRSQELTSSSLISTTARAASARSPRIRPLHRSSTTPSAISTRCSRMSTRAKARWTTGRQSFTL